MVCGCASERISRSSIPSKTRRFREYWQAYHALTERNGVTAQYARLEMRRRTTLIGAMLLKKGEADGMICGTISTTARHLHYIDQVIGPPRRSHGVRHHDRTDTPRPPGYSSSTHMSISTRLLNNC